MSGVPTYLTAAEIAALKLSGMPAGRSQTYEKIKLWKQGFDKIRIADRGGNPTAAYHIDLLPAAARIDYAGRWIDKRGFKAPLIGARPSPALSVPLDNSAQARLALLHQAGRFASGSGLSIVVADRLFAELYNSDALDIDEWIKSHIKQLSARSLRRWRAEAGQGGEKLSDKRGRKKGSTVLERAHDGGVKAYILALLARQPHLTAQHIRAAVIAEFGDALRLDNGELRPAPPIRTFQNYIAGIKRENANVLTRLTDPDKYKSAIRMVAAGGMSKHVTELNQLWEIDASPADVMLKDGRHAIYLCIDIYTRRAIVHVSKTARSSAVGLLLRKAILAWGVPQSVKTDQGSDFISRQTSNLFSALDIEHLKCPPGRPDKKPFVERCIGTYQRQFVRTLPGFIGHSVSDRKIIETRRASDKRAHQAATSLFAVDLDCAAFQALSDQWSAAYNSRKHSSLGRTPDEQAALSATPIRMVDARALDVLLAPIAGGGGYRQVTKSGIRVDGHHYLTADAAPGARVLVRHNPEDMGRVWLFDEGGEEYLGEAFSPELAGLDPAEMITKIRAAQSDFENKEIKKIKKAARKIGPRDVMRAALDAPADSTVLAFPPRVETHDTAALDAAAAAASGPALRGMTAEQQASHERLKAEFAAGPQQPVCEADERYQRFCRARDLEATQNGLSGEDARWLSVYQKSNEYQTMTIMEEDFGEFYRPQKVAG